MKERTKGFLSKENIPHDSEQFDYIVELHEYLWRFIRAVYPGAGGILDNYLDQAIDKLEAKLEKESTFDFSDFRRAMSEDFNSLVKLLRSCNNGRKYDVDTADIVPKIDRMRSRIITMNCLMMQGHFSDVNIEILELTDDE